MHGRSGHPNWHRGTCYDYIDDHSRVAYAEIHDNERGATAAGVLERAIPCCAALDVTVERVISDNAFAYRHSTAFRGVIAAHGIMQINPHCPWTNGRSRTPEPRPNRRTGLRPPLDIQHRPQGKVDARARPLQPKASTPRHRRQDPIDRINNGRGQYT